MKQSSLMALALISLILPLESKLAPSKTISYIGSFDFPNTFFDQPLPNVPVYYKGTRVPTQEGAYLFSDTKRHVNFSIIISLLKQPSANTISRFEIPEGVEYLACDLTRKPKSNAPDNSEDTWQITLQEGIGPAMVPEDSLIILMNPACIQGVKPVTWTKEGISLKLPTIAFKDNLDKDGLYARALFANLDVAQFHKPSVAVTLQQDKKSISSVRKT